MARELHDLITDMEKIQGFCANYIIPGRSFRAAHNLSIHVQEYLNMAYDLSDEIDVFAKKYNLDVELEELDNPMLSLIQNVLRHNLALLDLAKDLGAFTQSLREFKANNHIYFDKK